MFTCLPALDVLQSHLTIFLANWDLQKVHLDRVRQEIVLC